MDFGSATYIDPIASVALSKPVLYSYGKTEDSVRLGVNFKFDFGGGKAY